MGEIPATEDQELAEAEPDMTPGPLQLAPSPPQFTAPDPILAMIERAAKDPTVDIDKFERLMALQERVHERRAKAAFNAAMAAAKGALGPIVKTHEVAFTTGKGGTRYKYEELSDIAKVIDPVFQLHGLSYRFSITQDGPKVRVTCIVSHAEGAFETTSLEATVDAGGTSMNSHQALGSVLTYLQRYSLRAALGLAVARDDDGRLGKDDVAKIDVDQLAFVEQLLRDTASDVAKFLATLGCADISNMTLEQFKRGVALLEEKKRRAARAAQ